MESTNAVNYRKKLDLFNVSENYQADILEASISLSSWMEPGDSMLDIGCGTGYFCEWIEKKIPGLCAYGIDKIIDSQFTTERCWNQEMNTLANSVDSKGMHVEQYHAVTMLHSVNHMSESLNDIFWTVWCILKPGGVFVILTNDHLQKAVKDSLVKLGRREKQHGDSTMLHNYAPSELRCEAANKHFDLVSEQSYGEPVMDIQIDGAYFHAKNRYIVVFRKPIQ